MARESSVDPAEVERVCVELLAKGESQSFPKVYAMLGSKGSAAIVQAEIDSWRRKTAERLNAKRTLPDVPGELTEACDAFLMNAWKVALGAAGKTQEAARQALAEERATMLAQVQAEVEKAAEVGRRNHELTGLVAAMREQIDAFERRIAGLEATLSERDSQLSDAKNDLATARATLDSERSAHQSAMAELRKTGEEKLAQATEQHKKELATQEDRAAEERKFLHETTDQIRTAARAERDRLFALNARLESERDENFALLTTARAEVATWRGKAEATQENLAAERQRADRVEADLRAALTRPGPTLEEMIAACDPSAPPPKELLAWAETWAVGKEKL